MAGGASGATGASVSAAMSAERDGCMSGDSATQGLPPPPADVTVRSATRDDMPLVLKMIQELARYEGEPDGPRLSVQDLIADGFDSPTPWFFGLIAEVEGAAVGHALCNRAYSSWTRRAYYVEDLYVRPHARRLGVGRSLLKELCRMAVRDGVHRVDWHVLESNEPALRFYAKIGAKDMHLSEGRAAMRLHRDCIEQLANDQML